jgi:serine protease Do
MRRRMLCPALAGLLLIAAAGSAVDAAQWAWLGVRIRDLSEQEGDEISKRHGLREGFGVLIIEVMEGTPAEKAGLKNGDLVVGFEERQVTETRLLQRLIASAGPGRDVRLTILRAEGRRRLEVKLASMPRSVVGERIGAEFGFVVREPETSGPSALSVVIVPTVAVVVPRSPADRAGLEVGDVILQVGERVVLTREEMREALADASLEAPLRLTFARGSNRQSVTLRPPGGA